MSAEHGALVLLGSGPGIGRDVATVFVERGFKKTILLSRNPDRLPEDAKAVRSARDGTQVHEITVDFANAEQVDRALEKVTSALEGERLECVVFNAARPGPSKFFEWTPESLQSDLQICVVSLYTIARWAMPRLLETASSGKHTPSFLVTSGILAKDPFPAMFSLAAGKAGQYSLVQSLHKEFEPKGVHCSLVIIGGSVSEDSKVTNPRNIGKEMYETFSKPRKKGSLEVVLQDPDYENHVKNREK
ncbi:NAD(P)-binding protein [Cadophora sp. DSE1049]|nr:NAD(P)-binding protein [Cadophora sp. DSE1049]